MRRVFSGIQPTGEIHLGNYLGAIKGWVEMQHDYHNFFCVVDLHAITQRQSPTLADDTLRTAALYLACGINPANSTIFVQSHVPAHAELGWLLNCITPMGWLNKMTQYREKSETGNPSVGLFDYPVLMASDILLYQTDVVPVGDDQRQHLNLVRDLAEKFNKKFGATFVVPTALYQRSGARIMSLLDGTKKMSKSDENPKSRINLLDNPTDIAKKIRRCTTDLVHGFSFAEDRAEARNLLTIYQNLSGKSREDVEVSCADMGWSTFKELLTETVIEHLKPIQQQFNTYYGDKFYLERLLKHGAERSNNEAAQTIKLVKERMYLFQ